MTLGRMVKTRQGDRHEVFLIEGDRDALLDQAGLMKARPDHSAADSSDEQSSLRAENTGLRAQLAIANDEIERLRSAEVIEETPPSWSPRARRSPPRTTSLRPRSLSTRERASHEHDPALLRLLRRRWHGPGGPRS